MERDAQRAARLEGDRLKVEVVFELKPMIGQTEEQFKSEWVRLGIARRLTNEIQTRLAAVVFKATVDFDR